uniref:Orf2-1 n=1 Tax=Thanatephorus cucumeris TaxID=107832 RepID=Q870A5_THACU|nr:orf2-1 [Rhizoctonia solani]
MTLLPKAGAFTNRPDRRLPGVNSASGRSWMKLPCKSEGNCLSMPWGIVLRSHPLSGLDRLPLEPPKVA